ncbi:ribosome small subunit-dependent GTPase A [Pseudomarimonas arenosa]|uniref:Small ribosomal subunit biogenesis GTPase RsgA n=1 Tax=Pseudomarimonas arenosa TaxID=2774145 RepID=A0AAW3ZHW4_9GAMM|nr:ribosome small subunit-dependent GTPase A [Pseudomarimonas arenosa]MBD8525601.1 ribosome small subunit-dependent GTPase A [Pseudomarimonas arenosa]
MSSSPAPPSVTPGLAECGWRDDLPAAQALSRARGRVARVTEQHRSGYKVTDGEYEFAVQSPSQWVKASLMPEERATVGDWVLLDPAHDRIEALLPRQSLLRRAAAGEHYKQQLIAANIDTVLVVAGLDGDFNPRRLERYVAMVGASGARPVIVLTKVDLQVQDAEAALAELAKLEVAVVRVNAREAAAREALQPWLAPGQTLVLVGSSGAGKSTLTNTLLGHERQRTGAVRDSDARGRHTTTHRSLLRLPGGACLIDTPGMRELKLTGEEDLDDAGFADIETLAADCKFRDCRHDREPGCAIRAALESGDLDRRRWEQFLKLGQELGQARQSLAQQLERRAEDKRLGKALNKRLVDKYGKR